MVSGLLLVFSSSRFLTAHHHLDSSSVAVDSFVGFTRNKAMWIFRCLSLDAFLTSFTKMFVYFPDGFVMHFLI